jgi:DNA modification methylase
MTTESKTDVTGAPPVRSSAWLGRIVCGDRTEIMRSLPPESVNLTVTSPPYNLGKEYEANFL